MQQWNFTMCKHPTAYAYTFPNGSTLSLAIAREPGRIGWVTGRTYTMGATPVYGWQVSHDALGRPVSTADSESAARTWTYNERSEMTGCTSSDGSHSYFYDSIGNRTSSSSTSSNLVSVTHSYTANGLNQYDYVDSTAFTYDADGNLTGDGRYSYAYDCENRLVSVTPVSPSSGDLAIVNEYDHMNRRVRKTVRRYDGAVWSDQERHSFVWDGWNIVLERIDAGGMLDTQVLAGFITKELGGVIGEEYSDPTGQDRIVIVEEKH